MEWIDKIQAAESWVRSELCQGYTYLDGESSLTLVIAKVLWFIVSKLVEREIPIGSVSVLTPAGVNRVKEHYGGTISFQKLGNFIADTAFNNYEDIYVELDDFIPVRELYKGNGWEMKFYDSPLNCDECFEDSEYFVDSSGDELDEETFEEELKRALGFFYPPAIAGCIKKDLYENHRDILYTELSYKPGQLLKVKNEDVVCHILNHYDSALQKPDDSLFDDDLLYRAFSEVSYLDVPKETAVSVLEETRNFFLMFQSLNTQEGYPFQYALLKSKSAGKLLNLRKDLGSVDTCILPELNEWYRYYDDYGLSPVRIYGDRTDYVHTSVGGCFLAAFMTSLYEETYGMPTIEGNPLLPDPIGFVLLEWATSLAERLGKEDRNEAGKKAA